MPCWQVGSAWVWAPVPLPSFCLQIPGPVAGRMKVEGLSLTSPQGKRAGPLGEKMEWAALGEEESWTSLAYTFANPLQGFSGKFLCFLMKCLSSAKLL